MAKTFTEAQYLAALEKCGWLETLSAAKQKSLKRLLKKRFPRAGSSQPTTELYVVLADTNFDMECIDSDGSYVDVVKQLAKASGGLFAPKKLSDSLDLEAEKATVSFELGGRPFKITVPFASDWFDPSVITKLINGALKANQISHRFQALPTSDQCLDLAFVPDAVWKKAIAADLIPVQDEVMDVGDFD